MKKLLKGYKLAASDLSPTFSDSGKLGFSGLHRSVPAFKIVAPRFAHQLGSRAILLLLDFLDLLSHSRWKRDREGVGGSHKFRVLLVVT